MEGRLVIIWGGGQCQIGQIINWKFKSNASINKNFSEKTWHIFVVNNIRNTLPHDRTLSKKSLNQDIAKKLSNQDQVTNGENQDDKWEPWEGRERNSQEQRWWKWGERRKNSGRGRRTERQHIWAFRCLILKMLYMKKRKLVCYKCSKIFLFYYLCLTEHLHYETPIIRGGKNNDKVVVFFFLKNSWFEEGVDVD